ncbi:MAG: hypothetical protein OEZ02_10775 [Anaerolineae bacterium]|nr:hypothetical protein [Anaerolineae bacterium]
MTDTNMQAADQAPKVDDHIISLLGGLIMGIFAWAALFALVAFIKSLAPPGMILVETIKDFKLLPPPGIDLSNVKIVITPLENPQVMQVVNIIQSYGLVVVGLIVSSVYYRKLIKLD